ncbi:hypothetical protein [Desulfosediminicola flagellatus]|uniref:hypothetical protein n=1 Tax=Desulfosediminicola flagellatus TaxID=2569541 RepID=UPI0010ABE94A|nr:hypothetical protein [Desulfosediminicola flagellatus]
MVANLTLSSSARLAFIGLGYIYLVKLIDTLWHGIFGNPTISFVVICLNILSGIAQFLFFYKLKSSTSNSGMYSNIAGWAGIIGALITIIPKILALSMLLQFYFSFNLTNNSQLIHVFSLWLGAVMLFCCCLIFSLLTVKIWSNKNRYFLIGTIGYMILTVTFSKLVLNFFSGFQINWHWGEIDTSLTYLIISSSASFLCIAYFYAGFFSGNENIGNNED